MKMEIVDRCKEHEEDIERIRQVRAMFQKILQTCKENKDKWIKVDLNREKYEDDLRFYLVNEVINGDNRIRITHGKKGIMYVQWKKTT